MASGKPGLGLLLLGGKPKAEEPDADDDMSSARVDAMKAFVAAVAKGDAERADKAMQAYHECCGLGEPDSDDAA